MSSWARVGSECVCIRDTPWIDALTLSVSAFGPVKDEYLVIDTVVDDPQYGLGLGFAAHGERDGRKPIYPIQFFKPIIRQSDDVALFTHCLDDVGEPA